jgi:urocanate hydratase
MTIEELKKEIAKTNANSIIHMNNTLDIIQEMQKKIDGLARMVRTQCTCHNIANEYNGGMGDK